MPYFDVSYRCGHTELTFSYASKKRERELAVQAGAGRDCPACQRREEIAAAGPLLTDPELIAERVQSSDLTEVADLLVDTTDHLLAGTPDLRYRAPLSAILATLDPSATLARVDNALRTEIAAVLPGLIRERCGCEDAPAVRAVDGALAPR